MANDRLLFRCKRCDDVKVVAKYYPSSVLTFWPEASELEVWMGEHLHGDLPMSFDTSPFELINEQDEQSGGDRLERNRARVWPTLLGIALLAAGAGLAACSPSSKAEAPSRWTVVESEYIPGVGDAHRFVHEDGTRCVVIDIVGGMSGGLSCSFPEESAR